MSPRPELTFACELDPGRLAGLFADASVIEDLLALGARVALMVSDFSDERAEVVRRLNAAGVPVVGIPLLPLAQGYYFTADNAAQAAGRYQEWQAWTRGHRLAWAGVGLDVEPDARIYLQIMDNPWGLAPMLLPRLFDRARPERSRTAYRELVDRIRADGWAVENYQFPLMADERRAASTLLQRLALVDVQTDREVWMIYSSFMRALGPGLIWSYGPEAPAIGVGTTGGGPDIPGSPQMPSLTWEEFARDLRLARHWCDQILIHSLEGCVWQGFLGRLRSFDWTDTATSPERAWAARGLRTCLRAALRASGHPWAMLSAATASCCLIRLRVASSRSPTLDRSPSNHMGNRRDQRLGGGRTRRALVALELGTGAAGLAGGALLMAAPDGSLLHADPAALDGTPFRDWRIPGALLAGLVGGGFLLLGGARGATTGTHASCR